MNIKATKITLTMTAATLAAILGLLPIAASANTPDIQPTETNTETVPPVISACTCNQYDVFGDYDAYGTVCYEGYLYRLKWWTAAPPPPGQGNVWEKIGACPCPCHENEQ